MKKRTYQYIFRIESEYPRKEDMEELFDIKIITTEYCIKAENKSVALWCIKTILQGFKNAMPNNFDKSSKIVSARMIFKNGNTRRLKVK